MSNDMNAHAPEAAPREVLLKLYPSGERRVFVSDHEVPYPDGKLIVSRTDPLGFITHCNPAFIEMSGYSQQELIGASHNILRHPDMPAVAFKGLWDDVTAGRMWHGYVKNLRKDSAYYWVYATVIANIRDGAIVGYTSVRRKPSRKRVAEAAALYRDLLEQESAQ